MKNIQYNFKRGTLFEAEKGDWMDVDGRKGTYKRPQMLLRSNETKKDLCSRR